MTVTTAILLFLAGFLSSAVNAIAGGGTFLTFGAMTLAGLPPIVANATSSIVQFPGSITSTLAYFKDLSKIWKEALVLGLISIVGSTFSARAIVAASSTVVVCTVVINRAGRCSVSRYSAPYHSGRMPSASCSTYG